jgi:cysteine-rich repeat protein
MSPTTLRRARPLFAVLVLLVLAFAAPAAAQIPPCGDGDIDLPELCDDGASNGQPGSFCTADCTIRPLSGGDCGNATLDGGEDCDEGADNGNHGSCCTAECAYRAATTPCRTADGVCDLVDTCTGSSGTCVDDKSTAVCRGAAGVCDVAESCDGVDDDCPTNDFEPSSVVCRGSAGVCDLAENCTGSTAACPADAKSGAVCRGAAGVCDAVETCDGVDDACPADAKSTAVCRGAAGVCDVAETCDGVDDDCPSNAFEPNTVECRGSAGVCDLAEHCTGSGAACPADAKSSAVCRAAAGSCDAVETCDGDEDDCPADDLEPGSVTCRASAGVCDLAEQCTGSSPTCPADAKSTAECRGSAGVCDVVETCDGVDDACPADGFASNVTPCRADAGQCDVAELCTGSSAACPADDFEPDETPCDDANVCSINDRCIGGVCGGFLSQCGNGTIEGSCLEECDDGNNDPGDGCTESCQLEPCGPAPLIGCRQLTAPNKAVVQIFDRGGEKNRLLWKYTPGDTTPKADFGLPNSTTSYQFCIYDEVSGVPSLMSSMHVPAGGTCGTKPCWKETGAGWKYTNKAGTPNGITSIGLKQGLAPGKTRIQVQGRGLTLDMPDLPFGQDQDVTLQLQASNGICWQAHYQAPAFRNLGELFKDK